MNINDIYFLNNRKKIFFLKGKKPRQKAKRGEKNECRNITRMEQKTTKLVEITLNISTTTTTTIIVNYSSFQ